MHHAQHKCLPTVLPLPAADVSENKAEFMKSLRGVVRQINAKMLVQDSSRDRRFAQEGVRNLAARGEEGVCKSVR